MRAGPNVMWGVVDVYIAVDAILFYNKFHNIFEDHQISKNVHIRRASVDQHVPNKLLRLRASGTRWRALARRTCNY
jgi:hypothetical protein